MSEAASQGITDLRLAIDIGGTFTDLVMLDRVGNVVALKTPSTPDRPIQAVARGLELLADQRGLSATELAARCSVVLHGTTVATNALLERGGARTALLTTAGFRDLLEMREGNKPVGRYDLLSPPPVPLVPRYLRLSIQERIRYTGDVNIPLDLDSLTRGLERLADEDVQAVAICFLHSTVNPYHERLAGKAVARRFPGLYVCLSHQVLPRVGEFDRLSTTVVGAYVGPVLADYLCGVSDSLRRLGYERDILVMQSHGGVLPNLAAGEMAAGAILSGPAGGVCGASFYGGLLHVQDLISLDMGGTSTDIALIQGGKPTMVSQRELGGVRIALPSLAVHTLGAGGGSVAAVGPDRLLRVGPRSAGARPGPACYGRGGIQPTVTDADLLLGYLDPHHFLATKMPLSYAAAKTAMTQRVADPLDKSVVKAAYAVYQLVNVQIAEGIRTVTLREGHDPRNFTLLAGGGAAGLHAAALARELGIPRVVVPGLAPVLSALGLLTTDVRYEMFQGCVEELEATVAPELSRLMASLTREGTHRLATAGIPEMAREFNFSIDLLYANQVHVLTVPLEPDELATDGWLSELRIRFERLYRTRYGYHQPDQPIHIRTVRLAAVGRLPRPKLTEDISRSTQSVQPVGERSVYLGEWVTASVYNLKGLRPGGRRISGPAVVDSRYTTVLLPPGCSAEVDPWGGLIIYVS